MSTLDLFERSAPAGELRALDLPDAQIHLCQRFLAPARARACFDELHAQIEWQRDEVLVFGRRHRIPRLHQFYSENPEPYAWSGLVMRPRPWFPALTRLRARLEAATGARYRSVLVNLYRDGLDKMGWHADDEAHLGPEPTIASLSLGATRDFCLRHRQRPELGTVTLPLASGSVLLMAGPTQAHWQHSLPARRRVRQPRINLTFRPR